MIRDKLASLVRQAVLKAQAEGVLSLSDIPDVTIEPPKVKEFGDFTTNVAMVLARQVHEPPKEVAEKIVKRLSSDDLIRRVEVAGGGFINFYLAPDWLYDVLQKIGEEGESYGRADIGQGVKVQVEYVSANPNGPITVAHGRGGVVGDVIANLYEALGYEVTRECYVNDALNSTQMQNFGKSVHVRYMQALGYEYPMPDDGYYGEYVADIARDIVARYGDSFLAMPEEERTAEFTRLAKEEMLYLQKVDLEKFGICFDVWFSEQTLHESGKVSQTIELLKERGYVYEKGGALWLKSSAFGDDKDRALVRSNGQPTYIAADAAYHRDKFARGFDEVIDVWGPDHHGYVARTKAAVAALGYDARKLTIIIYQAVRLLSGGERVMMSKRAGDVILLSELIDEVGKDAARFFFLMRSADSTLDFDLELAKSQSSENPVYYVQYAHARICSILRVAEEAGVKLPAWEDIYFSVLKHESEIDLMRKLADFPDLVMEAARLREPHRLTKYAQDLAALFHVFYTECRVVGEDEALTSARLALVSAAKTVLANVLRLMGISAPERM